MSQTLLEMAKELVTTELIRVHHLSPDDATALLASTHVALQGMHHTEATSGPRTSEEVASADWKRSITKYAVTCLE